MNILFICSKDYDYLQDLTYAGLKELLGSESVLDFPYHWQYHKDRRFLWSKRAEYPRNLGLIKYQKHHPPPRSRQGGTGGTLSPTASQLFIKAQLLQKQFDLVVLGSAKPDALETFVSLLEWIQCPWIFIDGGDWQDIGGDFERLGGPECLNLFRQICQTQKPTAIFKRELPLNSSLENVFPLPFSINTHHIPILPPVENPKFHVQFWAVESSQTRRQVFQLLKGRYDCDQNGSVPGQKFRTYPFRGKDYFQAVNQCRISLSFQGAGFDTLRYWEIPALGSLLISEQPTIRIPSNFIDGKHAVFCKNDLSDLSDVLNYYIAHPKDAKEITLAGQNHLLQYHTHFHRAEYIIETLHALK